MKKIQIIIVLLLFSCSGSKEFDETPVPIELLRSNLSVMDIVYNPLETKLAKDAKSLGAKVVSGVEMLIFQGAASFEIWTGKSAPVEVMRKAALTHLQQKV